MNRPAWRALLRNARQCGSTALQSWRGTRRGGSSEGGKILTVVLLVTALLGPTRALARPWPCLPPVFDGGKRLHPLPTPRIFWLGLLLRQHELCWTPRRSGEARVGLFGSSGVYGYPLSAEDSVGGLLNAQLAAAPNTARVFNLAFVTPYQVRDAVLIEAALPYGLDVIVYPISLEEFRHFAPMPFPTQASFFNANHHLVDAMTATGPPGLAEPFARYSQRLKDSPALYGDMDELREGGLYLRSAAAAAAETIAHYVNSPRRIPEAKTKGRQTTYDCEDVKRKNASAYRDWKQWNVLAYLEDVQRTRGVRVLVVHWPIAYEPVGDCYSVRYTKNATEDVVAWLPADAAARGLAYLDLHDLLPADLFLDSLHVSPAGHRRVAEEIARALAPILEAHRRTAAQ